MASPAMASALALGLAACTTLAPVADPGAYLVEERPARVWVTGGDGQVTVVEAPRLLGDTLVGFVDGSYREMPLSPETRVAVTRPAGGRTALVVGATVAVGAGLIALLAGTGPDSPHPTPEDPPTAPGYRLRPP